MSSGRKPTIAWVTVVAITISMSGVSVVHAQESSRPTLMDRFSSFKGSFKREKPTTRQATSNSPRKTSNGPRYGRRTYDSRTRSKASSGSRTASSAASPSGFSFSDLVPKNLFGMKKPAATSGNQQQQRQQRQQRSVASSNRKSSSKASPKKQRPKVANIDAVPRTPGESTPRATSQARVGSAVRSQVVRNQPRRSPTTTRHENIKETLSELFENEAVLSGEVSSGEVVVEADEPASNGLVSDEAVISDQEVFDLGDTASEETVSKELADNGIINSDQVVSDSDGYITEAEDYLIEDSVISSPVVDTVADEAFVDASQPEVSQEPVAIAAEEAPELVSTEPTDTTSENHAYESEAAELKPFVHARIDIHDALVSDELYDDWSAEDEAPEEIAPEEIATETAQPIAAPIVQNTPAETRGSLDLEDLLGDDLLEAVDQEPLSQEQVAEIPEPIETLPEPEPAPIAELEQPIAELEEPVAEFEQRLAELEEPLVASEPTWDAQPDESDEFEPQRSSQEDRSGRRAFRDNSRDSQSKEITRLRKPSKDVLVSTGQPVIVSHVEGPSSILVGREASYRVTLENTSRTAAHNLSAVIHVPEWADLVDVEATSGSVEQIEQGEGGLDWQLPELAAHSSHTIHLRLIPRSGRKFQLGVQWNQESVESQATVEVREPKLEMKISGPQEVLFGSAQRYRLTLSNPGTGLAEGVAVSLIPPGSDSSEASTHVVGTLGPEEVKELELELTAREAGELILQANATAEGGLRAEVIRRVLCRKPELQVDWRGPDQKYAGTETSYYFRVRNSGTATTEPVEVKARLPEGIRFLSASDSYAVDSVTGVVTWRLPSLTPGEEQFVQFQCQLDRPGLKEFDVTARTIVGDVQDSTSVRTEVVALADLKLYVNDPRGARPIGEPVLYEIRVENRGTTDARGISIVGLFSDGIDPVSVEGAQNSVRDGRVTFQPIKSLPAGGEVLLKIRAVASQVGTHIFRAEVVCDDLDIRLAAEETTRFFEDEFHWDEGETPYTAESNNATRVR